MPTPPKRGGTLDRRMGQAASVVMPLLEIAGIGYATYVVVYRICIQYLMSPSLPLREEHGIQARTGTAIALLVVYFVTLVPLLITWLRLLQVIWTNPGLIPLGDPSLEKTDANSRTIDRYDAYIADYDGWPLWCDKCHNFKPDRTHHCRELGRCVRRMDHYCPWAGGIIGETTHKFFVQFTFYGMIYTAFVLVLLAYFLSESNQRIHKKPATWIVALALAAAFFIFTCTMFFMTSWNLTINYTSVESIQRGGVQNIAMRVTSSNLASDSAIYPSSQPSETSTPDKDMPNVLRTVERSPSRTYVVMQTQPFDNPWDMGSRANWKSVMGDSPIDWFVPLKMSPCLNRTKQGEYEWGSIIYDMARRYEAATQSTRLQLTSRR